MLSTRRTFVFIACLAVLLGACAGQSASVDLTTTTLAPITTLETTTSTTTTTTLPPTTTTTTTTVPPVVVFDTVNGLEASNEAMERRAVVIKIDNHPNARAQSGLMEADLVYEMLVEGGLTRFAAVFHQTDLDYVGPVRSGRPTDVGVVRELDAPFQISGAQWWVQDIFKAEGLHMVYDTGVTTWRENHRSAPHNLFSSSLLLRDWADDKGWSDDNPGNVFAFGEKTESTTAATDIVFDWSDYPEVRWVWNGESYDRFNGDNPHLWVDESGDGGQVSAPVIVAIVGKKYWLHAPDGNGSSVPTTKTIGSGTAYVFLDGTVVEGAWDRERYTDPLHLTTADGAELILPPSRLWVAFFPDDATLSWN